MIIDILNCIFHQIQTETSDDININHYNYLQLNPCSINVIMLQNTIFNLPTLLVAWNNY